MYVLTQPVCALTRETTPSGSGFLTEINTSKHMSNENIQLKIDLLQEQIDNLEKSGFFTEKEINTHSISLKANLALFTQVQQLYLLSESAKRKADYMLGYTKSFDQLDAVPTVDFGLTKESYKEGKKRHDELFLSFNALKLKVVAAEILTQNHLEA
jgi:hypothetical protein